MKKIDIKFKIATKSIIFVITIIILDLFNFNLFHSNHSKSSFSLLCFKNIKPVINAIKTNKVRNINGIGKKEIFVEKNATKNKGDIPSILKCQLIFLSNQLIGLFSIEPEYVG
jgi:hypothetical protein